MEVFTQLFRDLLAFFRGIAEIVPDPRLRAIVIGLVVIMAFLAFLALIIAVRTGEGVGDILWRVAMLGSFVGLIFGIVLSLVPPVSFVSAHDERYRQISPHAMR